MSNTYPTKFDKYQEDRENNEKFSHIPDDLITEYLDLHQEKSQLEQKHQWKVNDLLEDHKRKKKLILLNLEANRKKMEEMSGLDTFALTRRLPQRREIEPLF